MNSKILGLLTVILLLPIASNAQVTTLYYQSDFMSGTSTYVPDAGTSTSLATAPFIGSLTASMILDGSLSANNLTLVSYDINFSGSNGINPTGSSGIIFSNDVSPGPFVLTGTFGAPGFCCGSLELTTAGGAITGANIHIGSAPENGSTQVVSIGPGGDSFSYQLSLGGLGGCDNVLAGGFAGSFAGTTINPCTVSVSTTTPGAWVVRTQAPEIDPISAASGLTLLLGSLLVLQGRRIVETPAI